MTGDELRDRIVARVCGWIMYRTPGWLWRRLPDRLAYWIVDGRMRTYPSVRRLRGLEP